MAKGQQKTNKEAKKPKKDTSPPKAPSGGEPVRAILDPGQAEASAVTRETPVENLLGLEVLRRLGAVIVIDPDHRLCGVVTEEELARALATSPPRRY